MRGDGEMKFGECYVMKSIMVEGKSGKCDANTTEGSLLKLRERSEVDILLDCN